MEENGRFHNNTTILEHPVRQINDGTNLISVIMIYQNIVAINSIIWRLAQETNKLFARSKLQIRATKNSNCTQNIYIMQCEFFKYFRGKIWN